MTVRQMKENRDQTLMERIIDQKYYIMTILTGLIHILFCIIFFRYHVWSMAIYDIFAPLLYFSMIYLIRQKKEFAVFIIAYIEILLHGILSICFVGWDCGFAQYVIALISLVFFAFYDLVRGQERFRGAFVLSGFAALIYIICRYCLAHKAPVYALSPPVRDRIYIFNSFGTFVFLFSFLTLYTYTLYEMETQLKEQNAILDIKASTDPLTSLLNRRSMRVHLDQVWQDGSVFSAAMCDIDDFKRINDSYGHEAGDLVLQEITKIIRDTVPHNMPICRWGGEEILILFQNMTKVSANRFCERIRSRVEMNRISFYDKWLQVTITIGIAEKKEAGSIEEIISEADNNLYRGKKDGKNKVVMDT